MGNLPAGLLKRIEFLHIPFCLPWFSLEGAGAPLPMRQLLLHTCFMGGRIVNPQALDDGTLLPDA